MAAVVHFHISNSQVISPRRSGFLPLSLWWADTPVCFAIIEANSQGEIIPLFRPLGIIEKKSAPSHPQEPFHQLCLNAAKFKLNAGLTRLLLVLFFQPIKNLEVIGFSFPWSSKEGAGETCVVQRENGPLPQVQRGAGRSS